MCHFTYNLVIVVTHGVCKQLHLYNIQNAITYTKCDYTYTQPCTCNYTWSL